MKEKFFKATTLLQPQIEKIPDQHRPHCLVTDTFFAWATDVAAKLDHYRNIFGREAWHIGPVSLFNKAAVDEENDCFNWLNSKKPSSVIYICFGSMTNFSDSQLLEIAVGLEASGC
ncbi:putative flavonol 3-O-glucosyltransferase [Rosa chinensis]|uniref:Putative flavonol 3-O-glucosyltransferase n=1 Tax=Rosa chinensis TaxID=74649 RepID=A0A2P6PM52_ROSCH|nr:putative flavonol 3-O-glucosyltransferase [Rosa chinensis]PRQ22990.1 putative flavonol 3-O-glucosyltransferase [Rosa chinensis]